MPDGVKNRRYVLKVGIGLGIMLVFWLLPVAAPLTPAGMRVIGIFLGTIWFYSTCALTWPSLLAIMLLGLSGAFASVDEVAGALFSNSVVFQMIIIMAICEGLRRSNAISQMARLLVFNRAVYSRPLLFTLLFLLIFFALGILLGIIPTIVIAYMVLDDVLGTLGFPAQSTYREHMLVALFLAACLGGAVFPSRGIMGVMFGALTTAVGEPVRPDLYSALTLALGTATITLMAVLIRYAPKSDIMQLKEVRRDLYPGERTPLTLQQKSLLGGLVSVVAVVFVEELVPSQSVAGQFLSSFGVTGTICLVAAALAAVRVEGRPLLELGGCMRDGVPWSIIFAVGTMMCTSTAFSSQATGITEFLQRVLGGALWGLDPMPFIFVVVLMTVVISGFMSNYAVCVIMLNVALPISAAVGVSPLLLGIVIVFSSMLGALSPGASGPAPLLYGRRDLSYPRIYKALLPFLAAYVLLAFATVLVLNPIFIN